MNKFYDRIVLSKIEPSNHHVLWLDITDINSPLLRVFLNGRWIGFQGIVDTHDDSSGGSGSGGSGSTTLSNHMYYGGSALAYTISNILDAISTLHSTNNLTVGSTDCNNTYYYILVPSTHRLYSVKAINTNEVLEGSFQNLGTFEYNSISYIMYEFHLDSLLPLDENISIRITKQ